MVSLRSVLAITILLTMWPIAEAGETEDQAIAQLKEKGLNVIRVHPYARIIHVSKQQMDDLVPLVAKVESLHLLHLMGSDITDKGVKGLAQLVHLEEITLPFCEKVTGTGFNVSDGFKNLRKLGLTKTKVNDEGLEGIAKLPALEELDLSNTDITDAGLKHLGSMKKLKKLALGDLFGWGQVTVQGVNDLAKALPDCKLYRGGFPTR